MYRRTLLTALGAGPFAAHLDWEVHDQTSTHSSGSPPTPSPDRVDYGQYGGGPGNRKHFEGEKSPTGITGVEEFESEEFYTDIAVGRQGYVFAVGDESAMGVTPEGETSQINVRGTENNLDPGTTPIVIDGTAYFGDVAGSIKYDIENGRAVKEIEEDSRAFRSIVGEENVETYQDIGGGFAEFDHEEMEITEEWMQDIGVANPRSYCFIPFEDSNHAALVLSGGITFWDLSEDDWHDVSEEDINLHASSDEEVVVAQEFDTEEIVVYEADPSSIDLLGKTGGVSEMERPMALVDEGDGVRSVYGVDVDGTAFRAEFDGNEEVLEMDWDIELDGSGYDAIVWGDTLVTGTDQELALLDRKTGDVIERYEEYAGVPSMPHGNRLYVAAEDGGLLQVKLQIGEPTVGDYANDEEIVDPTGLRDATDDWRGDEIELDLLRDVIAAWQSGESLD